jgi:uncharacterized RmlC-like cupin family protein
LTARRQETGEIEHKRGGRKKERGRRTLVAFSSSFLLLPSSSSFLTSMSSLTDAVEGSGGIFVIRGSPVARSWNGIQYKIGMSSKNVPAKQLSMNVAVVPPGAVAYAHVHVGFEVMLYILEGRVRHEYGDGLKQSVENAAGDFIYIEPGVPHEVFNLSDTEPVVAVVARSDADEWAHIVTYDRTTGRLGERFDA